MAARCILRTVFTIAALIYQISLSSQQSRQTRPYVLMFLPPRRKRRTKDLLGVPTK
jgi:hypothetical protein